MAASIIWCPSCRGRVRFDIRAQRFACERCDATYTLEEIERDLPEEERGGLWDDISASTQAAEGSDAHIQVLEGEDDGALGVSCPNCGARAIVERSSASTSCPFCDTYIAVHERMLAEAKPPSRLLPFTVSREDAFERWRAHIKRRPLLPRSFRAVTPDKLQGVYAPYWLFGSSCQGAVSARCENITTWSDSDYDYTRTDTYHAQRAGEVAFADVPFDASEKLDDALLHGVEPYDNDRLQPFSIEYLIGYSAACPDTPPDTLLVQYKDVAKQQTQSSLVGTISGYDRVSVQGGHFAVDEVASEYAVYPVWLLSVPYKERTYTYAINGQTGRIAGQLPSAGSLALKYFLLVFGALTLGAFLVQEVIQWIG